MKTDELVRYAEASDTGEAEAFIDAVGEVTADELRVLARSLLDRLLADGDIDQETAEYLADIGEPAQSLLDDEIDAMQAQEGDDLGSEPDGIDVVDDLN